MVGKIKIVILSTALLSSAAFTATILSEGFEGSFPPTGWTQLSVEQATTYKHDGTYSARLGAASDYLITPPLTNAQSLTCWTYTTSANPDVIVETSTSLSGPWTAVSGSPFSGNTDQWNEQLITLASSGVRYVQFRKSGTGTLYVDDVSAEDSWAEPTNTPPVLTSIGNKSLTVSNSLYFSVMATDADNDFVFLLASNLPPGAVFNPTGAVGVVTNTFSWAAAAPTGTYTTTFYADDGTTKDFETITITVTNAPVISNIPPVLDSIGNKEALEGDDVVFTVTASDPVDGDPISLSASNLPPGAVFSSGVFTWSNAAPADVYSVTFTATDKDGSDSETINITISERPVLMITEVADPAGTGGGDYRFVEIYNAGSAPVILEGGSWFLSKQVNGGSWSDVPLAGTIPAGGTWVVAYSATKFEEAYGFAPDESDSDISGTGDDAYFLFSGGDHTTGTLVDVYGEFDTDGTDTAWEYTDSRAVRNFTATGPNTTWTASEWFIIEDATTDMMNPGLAYNAPPSLHPIGNKGGMEGRSISFEVTAEDLADDDVITLTASNLPPGAVFIDGIFTWDTAAPVGDFYVTFIATDKDGSDSETITITVIEQPLLMISEIADPGETGGDAYRFVEIYNAGTGTVDLVANSWYLSKQVNGGTWDDMELTGILSAGATWVIAGSAADFETAYGFAPDQENSDASGNGNDAYFLFYGGDHTSGILIDIFGEFDTDGADTAWDYEDSRAERKEGILQPNTDWTADEWTITAAATVSSMTPGQHGPLPVFQGLENQFVFLGDDLALEVTAVNTVKTDVITLYATALPDGALFPTHTATNSVSSLLSWSSPAAGVYSVSLAADGAAGTRTRQISVTVSATDAIDGYFPGWAYGTIVKLENGQFWHNTGGAGSTISPALRSPDITITNVFNARRMIVDGVPSYTTVERIDIIESSVESTFSGLHNGNVYELADGTVWKQTSYENISSSEDRVSAWRWTENGDTFIQFTDRGHLEIGTCRVTASAASAGPVSTQIDGWFRGWKNQRIFMLANGEFWQQTTADSAAGTLYRPTATLTNYLGTGTWRLIVEGSPAPGYVEVQQLTNVVRTAIDGIFYGFGINRFFHLQNGEWWRQTSAESSASTQSNPEILVWNNMIQMPDTGYSVSAEQLAVITESSVIGTFHGLRYARYFNVANDVDWVQTSFENVPSDAQNPVAVVWADNQGAHLLARDQSDRQIGTCTVVAPNADDDGDGIKNIDEVIAGTSLLDRNDLFLLTLGSLNPEGRAVLNWPIIPGRTYTIEWTPSLLKPFQTLEILTDWTRDNWTDTINPPGSGGFYQVRVQLTE